VKRLNDNSESHIMKTIEQENQEILITRYLTGEISFDEIVELKNGSGASKDNLTYFQQ
jgi:predicted HTH domain antitoxin